MNLRVELDEHFEKPIEVVWSALTDPDVLAEWLMPNDFAPVPGRAFTFVPDHETPWKGDVHCRVLDVDPPRKMVWSWQTEGMDEPSTVTFELTEDERGTRLRFHHHGESDAPITDALGKGWPARIGAFVARVAGER